MPLYIGLNIVTLVMCVITLTLAVAALMPQIKHGLMLLRDGVLWALLLLIIAFVGFVGWGRLFELRQRGPTPTVETPIAEIFDFRATREPQLDPLPLPTAAVETRAARIPRRIQTQTIPVVQVSENTRKKVTSTSGFAANRSQKPAARRISSTVGLSR